MLQRATALARFVAAWALVVAPLPCACARAVTGATNPPADDGYATTAADVADGPEPDDVATPAPVDAPPAPSSTSPGPEQRGLVAPEPDAALAALPTDVRLPDRTAWQAAYGKDCKALAASPCELTGDLDGNGVPEQIVAVRSKGSKHAGIAVLWDSGGGMVPGGGDWSWGSEVMASRPFLHEAARVQPHRRLGRCGTWRWSPSLGIHGSSSVVAGGCSCRPSTSAPPSDSLVQMRASVSCCSGSAK
jgi:hypothetical protein